ncbi:uncharacterized protein L201_001013 [Kwoniella dendrophila CBS 6074]|uniref:Large ribosomal subunit protein mL46 N-terminal domain-containing protein n=1 Tax=Kwoniella dendrophila CBS 6074 TaxID=1295534 RepID=A0AAX4JL69_9TREE
MSFSPRSMIRPTASIRRAALQRFASTASSSASSSSSAPTSSSSSSSSSAPPLIASLILSRTPLLTSTPNELEKNYYEYSRSIKNSLSTPLPTEFYFKSGSLPLRRFLKNEYEYNKKIYGERLTGNPPDNISDIPPETEYEILPRDHWEKQESEKQKGNSSLERFPEEEVYYLIQKKKNGKWIFPNTKVDKLQSLDEAIQDNILGINGFLNGKKMDSWLVTKKPIGFTKDGEQRTFFLRGHILAGQPTISESSEYASHAWLNVAEIEETLKNQGDEKLWDSIKGMFGISEENVEDDL